MCVVTLHNLSTPLLLEKNVFRTVTSKFVLSLRKIWYLLTLLYVWTNFVHVYAKKCEAWLKLIEICSI